LQVLARVVGVRRRVHQRVGRVRGGLWQVERVVGKGGLAPVKHFLRPTIGG